MKDFHKLIIDMDQFHLLTRSQISAIIAETEFCRGTSFEPFSYDRQRKTTGLSTLATYYLFPLFLLFDMTNDGDQALGQMSA
jgi:hypothetical protein